jgi:hypothetical protein
MRMRNRVVGAMGGLSAMACISGLLLASSPESIGTAVKEADLRAHEVYQKVVADTAGMVGNPDAQRLAQKHGLQVLNLTWEDTGRYKGSCVGPNISDMTIQVQQKDPKTGQYSLTCMPVIRFPNFEDKTADITTDQFFLLTGNEKGKDLQRMSLEDYLANIRKYLTKPDSWKGDRTFLHASRDEHVLVSAQACFLPIPMEGKAEFNPVLFNYQSVESDPAVLTILATREGTSVTVIDNKRDGFQTNGVWGQRLFFNHNGERASLTGQRLSDFQASQGDKTDEAKTVQAAGKQGLNMVLLIQVPLKQKNPMRFGDSTSNTIVLSEKCCQAPAAGRSSDVEAAVIGHGKVEGPFTEIAGLDIERDPKFPVRVTVQFYKATSNGVVSENDMTEIAEEINKVYSKGDFVGSLVTGGDTGRPTEYDGDKVQPPDWWEKFWQRHHANTGYSRQEVIEELRKLHGADWTPLTEKELADEAEQFSYSESREAVRAGVTVLNVWRHSSTASRILFVVLFLLPVAGYVIIRRRLRAA